MSWFPSACSSFTDKGIKLNNKSNGSTYISFSDDDKVVKAELLETIKDVSYYGTDYKDRGYAVFGIKDIGKQPRMTSIYNYNFYCYKTAEDALNKLKTKGGKPKRQRKSRRKSRKSKQTRRK